MQSAEQRLAVIVPAGSPAVSHPAASAVLSDSVASSVLSDSVSEGLNRGQQSVLDCIKAHPGLKVPGIETETGIPAKSIERHVSALIYHGLIEHRGSKKTGGYYAK